MNAIVPLIAVVGLPAWAPNLHPLVVHFPIVWLIAAVAVDLVCVTARARWAEAAAPWLYAAGAASALAAYLSGRQAAATVLLPGMAQPIVLEHWNWALATTIYFATVATFRLALTFMKRRLTFWARAGALVAGLAGVFLLYHAAEQGARLVYEHGVGVAPRAHSDAGAANKATH